MLNHMKSPALVGELLFAIRLGPGTRFSHFRNCSAFIKRVHTFPVITGSQGGGGGRGWCDRGGGGIPWMGIQTLSKPGA